MKIILPQYLLFVSLLNHFWLLHCSPTPDLSIIFRPWSSYMCAITPDTAKAGSSYNHMRGPCIGSWFSDRSNCSQWSFEAAVLPIHPNICTDQWEAIVLYIYIYIYIYLYIYVLLYWPLYNYAAHAADILTPTTVVQGVDNHSWAAIASAFFWERSSRIFHFSRWLGQLITVLTKD